VRRTFWTFERVSAALDDQLIASRPGGDTAIQKVSTDTRTLAKGDLFIALSGERFDAHEFLGEAVGKGASAVVIARADRATGLGVPAFVVRDTSLALGALAHYRRTAWARPVVGIGGSNGKTTTKELTRSALASRLTVHATEGNLNNLVGVPLTLLALPDEADAAVVEMGVNVPGEMARLNAVAAPDIAVLTSVAEEHLEGLGSLEGVLREESLLLDGASVAIVPSSQPELVPVAQARVGRVVTAGLDKGDLCAERWGIGPDGLGWAEVEGVAVRPPVRGAHNLRNAMLALAVAREMGVSVVDAARGMAAASLPGMRLAWESLGRATLINDAYNASPASMRAALDVLTAIDGGRQRVAVLGPMRELGAHASRLHEEVARHALASKVDVLAAIGEMGVAVRALAPGDPRVVTAADLEELWPALEPRLARDGVILIKASRGVKLERLVPLLSAWAAR